MQARRCLIDAEEITRRLAETRSATLGTVDHTGRPHLVPIVFAYRDGRLYTAVDHKPKSTNRLKRLRNIETNSAVSVLLDHYDDDWTRLWWIRVDGSARVIASGPAFREGIALLTRKYQPYEDQPPPGPVIEIRVETIRAWSAT
ncbi:MAG: TIGR03668 family PPOX class F420-dependent oxidoreductase [bacterium]|nr:TIGR03668 family PPOX class F420-dependent oxidoreductase [bacterium]MDE0674635.1 TIGR03668 family PPOX class F420-dependent oxidoreductase [bacterium]